MNATLLWKPTLAATLPPDADLTELPYPLLASPKIDGVRALVQRGVLVSRKGRPIANTNAQKRFGRPSYKGLDGELTAGPPWGKDVFNKTVRVTQRRDADGSGLIFNVFDWVGAHGLDQGLKTRQAGLKEFYDGYKDVHLVRQTLIRDAAALLRYEAKQLAKGYEGVMLRRADAGPYLQKRSTLREFSLVKLKRMEHGMATLLRCFPLRHNDNTEKTATGWRTTAKAGIREDKQLVGSVEMVDDRTGAVFTVNVATAELRAWPGWRGHDVWRGKRVRYKYQPVGTLGDGAPRFPTATFEELL